MSTQKPAKKGKMEPGSEEYEECSKLLSEVEAQSDAGPFLEPVDWRSLGIPEYPKIIKKPMDLGTVRKKLEAGIQYQAVADFGRDIRLVWSNAMKFNQPGSDIYSMAEKLSEFFEARYTKIAGSTKKEKPASGAGAVAASADKKRKKSDVASKSKSALYQEKVKFAQYVDKLSSIQLGKIVEIIQNRCPTALNEEHEADLEIEVDNIDKATLQALNSYAETCVTSGVENPAKKSKK